MKTTTVLQLLIVITLISWGWLLWLTISSPQQPKIAYVKSLYVVENYAGTKEAYAVLQKQAVEWQVQLDSLKNDYQAAYQTYQTESPNLFGDALKDLERDVYLKQSNLERYQQIIQQKEAEEGKKLTEGVYAQIDSYLKNYVKEQGYDLVIGANAEGTVLYGSDAFDITEEVLTIINQQYQGQ